MKKNISIVVLAICVAFLGLELTACKPSPCKMSSYKTVDDELIIGVAQLDDGTYAVYIDFEKIFELNGEEIGKVPGKLGWPAVHYLAGSDRSVDAVSKKDNCGYYVILYPGYQQIGPERKKSDGYDSFLGGLTGGFVCSGFESNLCFDPSALQ